MATKMMHRNRRDLIELQRNDGGLVDVIVELVEGTEQIIGLQIVERIGPIVTGQCHLADIPVILCQSPVRSIERVFR